MWVNKINYKPNWTIFEMLDVLCLPVKHLLCDCCVVRQFRISGLYSWPIFLNILFSQEVLKKQNIWIQYPIFIMWNPVRPYLLLFIIKGGSTILRLLILIYLKNHTINICVSYTVHELWQDQNNCKWPKMGSTRDGDLCQNLPK